MWKLLLSVFVTILISTNVYCQQSEKAKLRLYQKSPVWINMMEDSNVNYHEAKLAFEEFWKGKEVPEEEGYETNENISKKSFIESIFENNKDAKKYAFEHKRFENWLRIKAPFVKLDGQLMTDEEVLSLITEELQRRKVE